MLKILSKSKIYIEWARSDRYLSIFSKLNVSLTCMIFRSSTHRSPEIYLYITSTVSLLQFLRLTKNYGKCSLPGLRLTLSVDIGEKQWGQKSHFTGSSAAGVQFMRKKMFSGSENCKNNNSYFISLINSRCTDALLFCEPE